MNAIYKYVTEFFRKVHDIDISQYDQTFINNSITKRAKETQRDSPDQYYRLLEQNAGECKTFIDSLNISYSEFFRNPLTFAVLEWIVLPALSFRKKGANRKEIRVWSAACAAGQEAYSLAILLEELRSTETDPCAYRIFATDQNASLISEALLGQYTPNMLNNMSLKRTRDWFTLQGSHYTVKPELKAQIDFSVFNLLDAQLSSPPASVFGDFDLIICANLLFYYKQAVIEMILEKTAYSLAEEGYLIIGEAEIDIVSKKKSFRTVFPPAAIFQKIRMK